MMMPNYVYRHKRKCFIILFVALLGICQLVIPSPDRPSHSEDSFSIYEPINDSTYSLPYSIQELPTNDFITLIDVTNFKFIINNFPCNGSKKSPFLLVLIHSAPGHTVERSIIRTTWGKEHDSINLLFLLGHVDSDETQRLISNENDQYGDMVQGSFHDAYRNMTYKHVMALKWAIYYCPGAKYILKTDDDVFVNTPYMLKYLTQAISPWGARKLMLCSVCPYCYVKRTYRSKWRVSPLEFSNSVYPPFCFGYAIIYSPDVIYDLYKEAQKTKYFWIDDVHVTGILAAKRNLTQSSCESLIINEKQVENIIHGTLPQPSFLFGPPNMPINLISPLWNVVESANMTL